MGSGGKYYSIPTVQSIWSCELNDLFEIIRVSGDEKRDNVRDSEIYFNLRAIRNRVAHSGGSRKFAARQASDGDKLLKVSWNFVQQLVTFTASSRDDSFTVCEKNFLGVNDVTCELAAHFTVRCRTRFYSKVRFYESWMAHHAFGVTFGSFLKWVEAMLH